MLERFANFNKMPAWTQAQVLEKEGTVLASRTHKGWEVKLYAIDNYFVELWEKQELKITTSFQKSAKAIDIFELYTDSVQVQDLIDNR